MKPTYELEDGTVLYNVHWEFKCELEVCALHKPSQHALRDAPRSWDHDFRMVTRVCSHGVVHPDYDSLTYKLAQLGSLVYCHNCCDGKCCGLPRHIHMRPGS